MSVNIAAPAFPVPSRRAAVLLHLVLVAAIACAVLSKSPWRASNLTPVPDAVEYAVAAERFAHVGAYDIEVDGKRYPPRYPPWFSLLWLAPVYAAGGSLGAGIVPVTILGVFGILAAWALAYRLSNQCGAALAALGTLALPDYFLVGRGIRPDVPACALGLAVTAMYVHGPPERVRALTATGILIALSASLRPVMIALLVPFAWHIWRTSAARRAASLTALLTPVVLLVAANFLYNASTFGAVFRSGYNFWCPVPYDYLSLTFGPQYVLPNVRSTFLDGGFWFAAAAAAVGVLIQRWLGTGPSAQMRRLLKLVIVSGGPIVVFHLAYFFPGSRFVLFPTSVLVVAAAAMLAGRLQWDERIIAAGLAVAAIGIVAARIIVPAAPPARRLRVDLLAQRTPPDSVIITALDEVYVEAFVLRGTRRKVVPFSRATEYADKLVAWHRIPVLVPPPANPTDHRSPGLANGGAVDAVTRVAVEQVSELQARARAGVPVFLDTAFIASSEAAATKHFMDNFTVETVADDLYRLLPP